MTMSASLTSKLSNLSIATKFEHLPDDCLGRLFSYFSLQTIQSFLLLSRAFHGRTLSNLHYHPEFYHQFISWVLQKITPENVDKYAQYLQHASLAKYTLSLTCKIPKEPYEQLYQKIPQLFEKVLFVSQGEEVIPDWIIACTKTTTDLSYRGINARAENFDTRLIAPTLKILSIENATWQTDKIPCLSKLFLSRTHVACTNPQPVPALEFLDISDSSSQPPELLEALIEAATSSSFPIHLGTKLPASSFSRWSICNPSQDDVDNFLKGNKILTYLSLERCRQIPADFYTSTLFPPALQNLSLTEANLTTEGLSTIVSTCQHLKKLIVISSEPDLTLAPASALPELESLEISLNLLAQKVTYLFETLFAKLKTLRLVDDRPNSRFNQQDFLHFPRSLESFVCKNSSIKAKTLSRLFTQSPVLQSLTFCAGHHLAFHKISVLPLSLEHLETEILPAASNNPFVQFLHKLPRLPSLVITANADFQRYFKQNQHLHKLALTTGAPMSLLTTTFPKNTTHLILHSTTSLSEKFASDLFHQITSQCKKLRKFEYFIAMDVTQAMKNCELPTTLEKLVVATRQDKTQQKEFMTFVHSQLPAASIEFIT